MPLLQYCILTPYASCLPHCCDILSCSTRQLLILNLCLYIFTLSKSVFRFSQHFHYLLISIWIIFLLFEGFTFIFHLLKTHYKLTSFSLIFGRICRFFSPSIEFWVGSYFFSTIKFLFPCLLAYVIPVEKLPASFIVAPWN